MADPVTPMRRIAPNRRGVAAFGSAMGEADALPYRLHGPDKARRAPLTPRATCLSEDACGMT